MQWYGQLRERLTHLSAIEFDQDNGEAGTFWTQRLLVGATYPLNARWSVHGSVQSALQEGVDTSPIERNHLDVYEAYIRYAGQGWQAKVGRQTLKLGSQRLIGWRDGTNVRRAWEGLRVSAEHGQGWQSEWLALALVDVEKNGAFNDNRTNDNQLAGTYHTLDIADHLWFDADSAQWEGYYLYTNRNDRNSIEGRANQLRHTLGTRFSGDAGGWYWNWEAAYQVGRHGDNDIRAWTLASNTGFRFDGSWAPELMISTNVASGDDARGDGKLATFDALFPRGSYFSEAAILGPANFYNIHPYLFFNPTASLRLFVDMNIYWRLESEDGVYGPPGNLIASPDSGSSKRVNQAYSAGFEYQLNEQVDISLLLTYSEPQAFLREAGLDDNTRFMEFNVNWSLF